MKLFRLLLLLLLFGTARSSAQDTTPTAPPPNLSRVFQTDLRVSTEQPLLGQPFEITMRATGPASAEIIAWPQFPSGDALEVIDAGDVIEQDNGDTITYERMMRVVMWETGAYLAPELSLVYQVTEAVESVLMPSFTLFVPQQIDDPLTTPLRPNVAAIEIEFIPRWWWIAGALVVIGVMMLIARVLQAGRRGIAVALDQSPLQLAVAQLEDLKGQNLPAEAIYAQVADQLRLYIQQRFDVPAVEMTSSELNAALRDSEVLPDELRGRLQRVLEGADLVKFARVQPDERMSARLINFAVRWLRDAERQASYD